KAVAPIWGVGLLPRQLDAGTLGMDAGARHRRRFYGRGRITSARRETGHNLLPRPVACTLGIDSGAWPPCRLAATLGFDVAEFRPVLTVVSVQIASKAPDLDGVQAG